MLHLVNFKGPSSMYGPLLMHNTARGRSPRQKGSHVRFQENVRFESFSRVIAHDFHHSGQFFCNIQDVHRPLVEDIWRDFHWFLDRRVHVWGLFGPFRCLCNGELVAHMEAKMINFIILTVPPPRTDHSLMHITTRSRSPGQKGSQVRFRENVCFGPFSWVIAQDFHQSGQFFRNIPDVHRLHVKTFG
jgi:hypothetical protein